MLKEVQDEIFIKSKCYMYYHEEAYKCKWKASKQPHAWSFRREASPIMAQISLSSADRAMRWTVYEKDHRGNRSPSLRSWDGGGWGQAQSILTVLVDLVQGTFQPFHLKLNHYWLTKMCKLEEEQETTKEIWGWDIEHCVRWLILGVKAFALVYVKCKSKTKSIMSSLLQVEHWKFTDMLAALPG